MEDDAGSSPAAQTNFMKVHYASDCSCDPLSGLYGGPLVEHFYNEEKAAQRFLEHEAMHMASQHLPPWEQHRYWSVHVTGKGHLISVR